MYQNRKFDYFDFLFFYFKKFIIFTKMDKFRVKLEKWLKANPGVIPKYTIYVETKAFGMRPGSFTEFCDYQFEDRFDRMETLPGVKVKTFYNLPLIGPIYSAEIELPIELLRETEIIREDKINKILK